MERIGRLITWWSLVGLIAAMSGVGFYFMQVWLVRSLVSIIDGLEADRDKWRDAWINKKSLVNK
jgi:hypothetical protein